MRTALVGLGLVTALWATACRSQTAPTAEGFFLNASAFAVLSDGLELSPGSLVGFSFRTCAPGELLRQTGDGLDELRLRLDAQGRLILSLTVDSELSEATVGGSNLLDGRWHTVLITVSEDGGDLSVNVSNGGGSARIDAEVVDGLDLASSTPELRVGAGLVACLREGPGVRFTNPQVPVNSYAVDWLSSSETCLLPTTCSGYDWSLLVDSTRRPAPCDSSACENGGICLPGEGVVRPPSEGPAPPGTVLCLCQPGYTGPNCGTPMSSCAENPCHNGANCVEDPSGGTGYYCDCSGTSFRGRQCQLERGSCGPDFCQNGGECLRQSGGFLCDCPQGYGGMRCNKTRNRQLAPTSASATAASNPCLSSNPPCKNNGSCLFSVQTGSVTCICGEGYSGSFCEVDLCASLNCPANSICINGSACKCAPGYTRLGNSPNVTCQELDECDSSPCQNGATCVDDINSYQCLCRNGYTGLNCEINIDYCTNQPVSSQCQNGGTCQSIAETASTRCLCPAGFTGELCQNDIDECLADVCVNAIGCTNLNGGYSCQCQDGWSGQNCDENVNECEEDPCQNGASCVDGIGGFLCQCLPGFEGTQCETNIDECASSPCLNRGTCTDGINGYTCQCPPEFMGPTCSDDYDPCAANPCENGGTCERKSNVSSIGENNATDYYCECPLGFSGLSCQVNNDECIDVVCTSNKVCVDLINAFECRCPQGFSGENCTDEINECDAAPCKNNATCIDLTDGYQCQCASGWTGVNCDEDLDECERTPGLCNNGICRNIVGSYECFCRPGFSGDHCSFDFDECLSRPCQNNGSCTNMINSYKCSCPPGFKGVNCEIDIDECVSNPCMNNATCQDGINNFTCKCLAGFTGYQCETNIDECEAEPCLNEGTCVDGINSYACICEGTGFEGNHCEINIDECATAPCVNNATCQDLINDYNCSCFDGYEGKNCELDIYECLQRPCQNNGVCYEKSNVTLYDPAMVALLPANINATFQRGFSYANAAGYVCSCLAGYEGEQCEIDIDECASTPCLYGECQDGIAHFTCLCEPGFEGDTCNREINECERYQPCQHGSCIDGIADYTCNCEDGFGGKNCSVALTGCDEVVCLNGGTCTPRLIGETEHRADCSCTPGYDGQRCQIRSTFSLSGDSYIKVPSNRPEGYELHMRFRTTLGNGLVAIGQGNTLFSLQLTNGKLNLHSNLISKFEGISIGENLNNTEWQKVYVAVNTTHLTLGVNDRLQATQPINPTGDNDTVFYNTFLGGIVRDQQILANNAPSFTGCIQDITVDNMRITEEDFKPGNVRGVEHVNTVPGCPRNEQCEPNPCKNSGFCTDLWSSYQCTCHRPSLGPSCQFNYTAGTFGHENATNSLAIVNIDNPQPYSSGVDISMFIRTRKEDGFIFYFGSDLADLDSQKSFITGQLMDGNLVVNVFLDGKTEKFQVYTVNLSDGYRHFIRVLRMNNSMMVKVNETVSINHEIPSPVAFIAHKLYLGNYPDPASITTTVTTTTTTTSTTPEVSTQRFTPGPAIQTTASTQFVVTEASNDITNEDVEDETEEVVTELEQPVLISTPPSVRVPSQVRRRIRRQSDPAATGPAEINPTEIAYFKGVIQDVQISDGGNVTRIVELFDNSYEVTVKKPDAIGKVTLIDVEKGVVSDNACAVNPCVNGGTCSVTWNDFVCTCPEGYRGKNCNDKEFCYWFTCPLGGTCVTLEDGHECLSNATFNGVNSTMVLRPHITASATNASSEEEYEASVVVTFRSLSNGTILQIIKNPDQFIRLSLGYNNVSIEVPETDGAMHSYAVEIDNDNGMWHTLAVKFYGSIVSTQFDNFDEIEITLDSTIENLSEFVLQSDVLVGASISEEESGSNRNAYNVDYDATTVISVIDSVDIRAVSSFSNHYRGCLGEIRIAGILVPFYTPGELVNNSASERFDVESRLDVTSSECILCYQDECHNGGTCQDPNEVFECACPTGFDDPLCGTNVDECIINKCSHGVCQDGIANYTCLCDPGWTGWLCDEDLDECLAEPCLNGGSCQQTEEPGNYTCECTEKFKGHNCELLRNRTCADNPCKNGRCDNIQNYINGENYQCDCTTLYKGVDCEIKKDFCEEYFFPCKNGATCTSVDSTFYFSCTCPPGYTGQVCEHEINECENDPCNGGRCTDLLNDFQCNCNGTGYTGEFCQTDIDECSFQPCQQGQCSNLPGSYECACYQGYCGTNCQREDPCQLNDGLCKNEGKCVPSCDEAPFYVCECSEEWEGQNCTIKSARRSGDIALIVGPVVGGMLFIAIVGVLVFLIMARRKRRSEGKYKPASQELTSPRLQLDNIIKPPPEERLI